MRQWGDYLLLIDNSARPITTNRGEDSMIISLLHKNYCISVHTISDPFDETLFVSEVDIGSKDGKSIIKITANQSFAAESDAEVCGLEMGRNWIDKH
jgi:hypothetical protein